MKHKMIWDYEDTVEHLYTMWPQSVKDAANHFIQEFVSGNKAVKFSTIALVKLGISVGGVVNGELLEQHAENYSKLVKMLYDSRDDIRAMVQELDSQYQLVPISHDGDSTRAGGRRKTIGFALADTAAAHADNIAQIRMMHGGIAAALQRDGTALPEPTRAMLTQSLDLQQEALKSLVPTTTPLPLGDPDATV